MVFSRPDRIKMGTADQPRSPRTTSTPSMSGRPRSRMIRVLARGCVERLPTRGGGHDLVGAGEKVHPQCADDLRLVVDDQDARHAVTTSGMPASRCGRLAVVSWITIVSPPPGVSSGIR